MSSDLTIAIRILPHGEGLPLPAYATPGAAGMDVVAAITDPVVLGPGARAAIPTGVAMAIPPGFEIQVRPRSGLAARHGLTIANAPGTIDSDYRGELQVLLINLGPDPITIDRGMRIAQLVPAAVTRARLMVTDALDQTVRGEGGFGSTGR